VPIGEQDDAELVRRARSGDKDAFALLVTRHRPTVLALTRRVLGDPIGATDATSEATLAALMNLERLRSPDRFGAWHVGIGLNIARRLRRRPAATGLGDEPADEGLGPEGRVEAAESARLVRRAVEQLPPGQREAVFAFYFQGLSHAEAASELGISPGAVKARLHQARGALEPELAPHVTRKESVAMTTPPAAPAGVEVRVAEVRRSEVHRFHHVVVLEERGGTRRLPIFTGSFEAGALACSLESVEMPRPMTYQLASGLIDALGGRIAQVRVTRLTDSTYYAAVDIVGPGGMLSVDARPSDALNVALVADAPILVDEALFEAEAADVDLAEYPVGAPDLAAEIRERQREFSERQRELSQWAEERRTSSPRTRTRPSGPP
jgi:RNA polymerase sigma factor (sigma-70 family)